MKIIIIDADSFIYLCCHNKKEEVEKSLDEIKKKLDVWLLDIFGKTYSTHYLMYLTEGKSFRVQYYPEYKSNRKGREKPKYFDEIKKYLRDKYKATSYPELEADDLCVITKNYYTKLWFNDKRLNDNPDTCFLAVIDKDLLNLEGEHYNYRIGEWVYTTKEQAAYAFWGDMIIGQSGDSISGLKGLGKVAVKEAFEDIEYNEYYLLVLKMYNEFYGLDKGIQEYYKTYKALHILDEYKDFVVQEPILINYNIEK